MARIVMLLKVTNNIFDIAIHEAIQQHHNIALGDVIFEIYGHLFWRPPYLLMAEIYPGGAG